MNDWTLSRPIITVAPITFTPTKLGYEARIGHGEFAITQSGKDMVDAGLRCLLAAQYGDEIEVPKFFV